MKTRLLSLALPFILAISLTPAVSGSILTVDTNPGWDGSVNSGWLGSGQSVTIVAGFETFDDIGFYFHSDSDGKTFDFVLSDAPNGGTTLYTTSFVVGAGINVIAIGQTLTAGATYYATMDYRGFAGSTAHFSYTDSYGGGNSQFGAIGSQIAYPTLDHRFIAHFSGDDGTIPEPATVLIWSALGICGLVSARRRRLVA